jgi:hypothetical protein
MEYAIPIARAAYNHYMGRNTRRRRKPARKSKRSGLSKSHANVPSRPPTRSIMQGSFNGSIRQFYTVPSATTYYKSFSYSSILSDAYASLAANFTEVRVNSLRVYYEPAAATGTTGHYAACLFDSDTTANTTPTYRNVIASPGSTARKHYQSIGLHWKWTEPDDANFKSTKSTDTICVMLMASAGTTPVEGTLIVDISIVLRNQSGNIATTIQNLHHHILHSSFDQIELSQIVDSLHQASTSISYLNGLSNLCESTVGFTTSQQSEVRPLGHLNSRTRDQVDPSDSDSITSIEHLGSKLSLVDSAK